MVKPKEATLGQEVLFFLFDFAIMLEPLNSFLYTWTFLDTLENEQRAKYKKGCRAFRLVSIILVPAAYLIIFWVLVFYLARSEYELKRGNIDLSNKYDDISISLFKLLGYWTTITNLASCVILAFVIRFVKKLTNQPIALAVSL